MTRNRKSRNWRMNAECLLTGNDSKMAADTPPVSTAEKPMAPVTPPCRFVTLPGTPTTKQPASPGDGLIRVSAPSGETDQDLAARIGLSSAMQNTFIAKVFTEGNVDPLANKLSGPLDITACTEIMVQRLEALDRGDTREIEHMLMGQASSLQAIFMEMSRRSALNMAINVGPAEVYMRLALKAQAQCRATLETLAEIKNPRPVYINPAQVNHANGPQQVNNGCPPSSRVPRENQNPPNKLKETK